MACWIWSVEGKLCTGLSMYLFNDVKSITNLNFFDFLGMNPACAHTSEVSLGSSLRIIPCFTRSSNSCLACALMCIGIARGLKRYREGSSLLERACFNLIFIGGQFMYLFGLRVSLKRDLCSLMNFCSYGLLVLISSSSSTFKLDPDYFDRNIYMTYWSEKTRCF